MKKEKEITEKDVKLTLFAAIFIIALVLFSAYASAQTYQRVGNDFRVEKTIKSDTLRTQFTYTSGNKSYPIIINKASGRCYINKISSKTGKYYKYYLSEEICREVCKETNIEYKPKNK